MKFRRLSGARRRGDVFIAVTHESAIHARMWLLASSACFYSHRLSSLGSPYALKAVRYSARMLLAEPDQQLLTFADLDISAGLRQNIAALGHRTATLVQTASLPALLAGEDVVAKARTGTGKTLAFLIPTIERLMISEAESPDQIRALVLSPTRELAAQIAEAAESLVAGSPIRVVCVFGGTSMTKDRRLLAGHVDLLVATPGRLWDHMENERLTPRLRTLQTLILDEGDRLLDQGFSKQIGDIVRCLPPKRQSLCFSATMPPELSSVLGRALRPGHRVIDCVGSAAQSETASLVSQQVFCAEMSAVPGIAAVVVREELKAAAGRGKVVVFCPTANQAQFVSELFDTMGVRNAPLHSRKSQAYRTRVSNEFRDQTQGVLVASDVAARGVDYPDVSLVVQMGAPDTREQYVHRTGRTGRAGKTGKALLLLNDWEERATMKMLAGLPIEKRPSNGVDAAAQQEACEAAGRVNEDCRAKAYQAWLGYYNQKMRLFGWDKAALVATANEFALGALALPEVPTLEAKTVGMMGLRGTPGLNVAKGPAGGGSRGAGGAGVAGVGGSGGGGRGAGGNDGRVRGRGGGRGATRGTATLARGRGYSQGRGGRGGNGIGPGRGGSHGQ